MPTFEYQTCEVASNMASRLIEHERFGTMLSGVDTDRIAFIHIAGKKKPKSLPTPVQIKALTPLVREIANGTMFVVVLYDEFYDWTEAKQFAALLEQLLLIHNDGRTTFEDGKLKKYDIVALSYMVDNFGVYWATQPDVKHPIEDKGATPTFKGNTGKARSNESNAVNKVMTADELDDIDDALDGIGDVA